jgi:hypothetical protein
MGHKKPGQLTTREVVKAIITEPVVDDVVSNVSVRLNSSDLIDDDAHLKSDVKAVKFFAKFDLTEEIVLDMIQKKIAKSDPTVTPERIRAAVEAVTKTGKRKALSK